MSVQGAYDVQSLFALQLDVMPKGVEAPDMTELLSRIAAARGTNGAEFKIEKTKQVTFYLFDIEGTTSALPFIRKVLFPAAEKNAKAYATTHYPDDASFVKLLGELGSAASPALSEALAVANAASQDDADTAVLRVRDLFTSTLKEVLSNGSTLPVVKEIQGLLWADAVVQQKLHTHVFSDVPVFFRAMGAESTPVHTAIGIYSTGSVFAQQMIMRHTAFGDLTTHITAYFDPSMVGVKTVPASYQNIRQRILKQLNVEDKDVELVFFTDNPKEVEAAHASGSVQRVVLCVRPLNAWVPREQLEALAVPAVCSFSQLLPGATPPDMDALVSEVRPFC